ncbi:MAG: ATP-binding protein, partial [Chloroflexi bacterium]|nr:ATP-binding protein [Chloroflexota bacterium]
VEPPSAVSAPRGADAPPPPPPKPKRRKPPEPEKPRLRVTSHVARDLLQNAAYFNALPKAVAEYVTNAIDSAEPGTPVICDVTIADGEVSIADNGSGMTYAELSNFFQMHGENIQRKRGRTVRGKFGTGKAAAFGVANTLQIETVKGGKRNVVELHRLDMESAKDGRPIPVREVAVDQSAPDSPPGTTIRIRDLLDDDLDEQAVRAYLEKLLGQHLRTHKVRVNGHACRYRMPKAELTFDFKPPETVSAVLGRVKCKLCVSPDELERDDNAIAVLCHGFLHATTLAGRSREPLVDYVFGEVEVPVLDDDPGPVPAFDNTRSLGLNPQNPKVQALEAWLGECIDEVLQKLVEREKRRQKAREQRLLRRVASRIKTFLDEDFLSIQESLPWASLPAARKRDLPQQAAGSRSAGQKPKPRPSFGRWLRRLLGLEPRKPKVPPRPPRGGPVEFEIRYTRDGAKSARAQYDAEAGVITLNRDHPQLRTAEREAGIESNTYKMLSFDIAFTEYALAVADYLAKQAAAYRKDLDTNALVQSILDRLGRKAAYYLETRAPRGE